MATEPSNTPQPPGASRLAPGIERLADLPWWLFITIGLGLLIVFNIFTNSRTQVIFLAVAKGMQITLLVSLGAYTLAILIGLLVGLGRVSNNKIIFNLAAFYVEFVRGVPTLVLLMYIAFVALPLGIDFINSVGNALTNIGLGFLGTPLLALRTRDVDNTLRVMVGLGVAYGAFEAEIFRAGIQSIEKGQMEAARALGMNYFQAMRYVILPQAIRRVLPALGNDFVAMVKDSSLVSVLGVGDITQLAKLYASSTFLFFETYSILAFLYLTMTIALTRGVRWLEGRMTQFRR